MNPFWKKESGKPTRHTDPDEAVARYLDQLHQADVAGASPPASALNGLGDAYLDKGDAGSAVDYYRQAAEVYAREGMHTNAIACLKKVRRHAADEGDTGLLLGRYYAAKKLVPDALAELEAYAERKQRTGDRKGALEAMKEVVRLVPDDASRRERLGDLLREAGQSEAALAAYREARTRYRSEGAGAGAERANRWIEELGGGPESAAAEPEAAEGPTGSPEAAASEAPPEAAAPVVPEDLETPSEEPAGEAAGGADPFQGLEIERTSYVEPPEADAEAGEETGGGGDDDGEDERLGLVSDVPEDVTDDGEDDLLTIAQQNVGTDEPVERMVIESSAVEPAAGAPPVEGSPDAEPGAPDEDDDEPPRLEVPDESPDLAAAAAELERAAADFDREAAPSAGAEEPGDEEDAKPADAPTGAAAEGPSEPADGSVETGSIVPEPRSHEEMMALAEQHVRTGEPEAAGRYLLIAAEGLREEGRWKDAADAYGRLAEIGEAKEEDFEDWVECARQAGRANAVLEALETASRWHLERGDRGAARRSAEEMFLVDPDSDVAAELLDRIAGPSGG